MTRYVRLASAIGMCSWAALLVSACTSAPAKEPRAPEAVTLRVLSSNGVKSVIEELQPELEREIGARLAIEFSTAAAFKTRIEAGDTFDVAILTPAITSDLTARGLVAPGSSVTFTRTGVGMGIREGLPAPDIRTTDGLKTALLQAKSLAFTAEGQSRATVDRTFDTLGITKPMMAKAMLMGPGEAPAAVAAGKADVVLTLASEILPAPGLQLVGPLPPEVQGYVSFAVARSATSTHAAAADALAAFLSSDSTAEVLRRHGMERVTGDGRTTAP